jgi:hypothetical protein
MKRFSKVATGVAGLSVIGAVVHSAAHALSGTCFVLSLPLYAVSGVALGAAAMICVTEMLEAVVWWMD